MKIVTVLRSGGGEFHPWCVQAMQRQVAKWAPAGTEFVCLSDVDVPGVKCAPLKYDWPGWWSKLELFRPDLRGDFLFTDLDNVILGPIGDFFNVGKFTCQRFGWTALMWIPENVRAAVWEDWIRDPAGHMETWKFEADHVRDGWGDYGDAGFISLHLDPAGAPAQHWETILPGQVMNIVEILGKNKRATAHDRDNLHSHIDTSVRYLRRIAPRRDDAVHCAMYDRTYGQLILLSNRYADAGGEFEMPADLPVPDAERWPEGVPAGVRVLLCGQPRRPWKLPMFQHLYVPDGHPLRISSQK